MSIDDRLKRFCRLAGLGGDIRSKSPGIYGAISIAKDMPIRNLRRSSCGPKSANYTRTHDAFRAREKGHTPLYYNEGPRLERSLTDSSHQGDHQRTESANTLERSGVARLLHISDTFSENTQEMASTKFTYRSPKRQSQYQMPHWTSSAQKP